LLKTSGGVFTCMRASIASRQWEQKKMTLASALR